MDGFKFVAPAIQRIADRLERFAVANDVADYLGVDEKLVRDHFSKGSGRAAHRRPGVRRCRLPSGCCCNSLLASESRPGAGDPGIERAGGGGPVRVPERVSGLVCNAFRWGSRFVFRTWKGAFPTPTGTYCRRPFLPMKY